MPSFFRFIVFASFVTIYTSSIVVGQPTYTVKEVHRDRYTKFHNYYTADGICSYRFTDIVQDKQGFMWFATRDGLMRFDGYTFHPYMAGEAQNQLPHNDVRKMVVDSLGNLWVGTMGGLCRYNPKTNDFTRLTHFFGKEIQGGKGVLAIFFDSRNRLWVDKQDGVLNCIDFNNSSLETYQHFGIENDIYPMHAITKFNDKILVGGANSLISLLSLNPTKWTNFKDTIVDGNALDLGSTADFLHIGSNEIWVANFGKRAYSIDKKTLQRKILPFTSSYTFARHPDGRVWVGGYSNGALLYNPITSTLTVYRNNENNPYSIAGDQIYKIYLDRQGNTWFATNKGLSVISQHRNRFLHIRKIPESSGLPTNKIISVLPDYPNTLWLGTENRGLIKYSMSTGFVKKYDYFESPDSIGSNTVTHVSKYNNQTLLLSLWNGRDGAVNSFSIPNQKFTRYHTSDKYYWYRRVVRHSGGEVYVGSWGGGILPLNLNSNDYLGRRYYSNSNTFFSVQTTKSSKIQTNQMGWIVAYTDKILAINLFSGDTVVVANYENDILKIIYDGVPSHQSIFTPSKKDFYTESIALLGNNLVGIFSNKSSSLVEVDLVHRKANVYNFNLQHGFVSTWVDSCIYLGGSGTLYRWDSKRKQPVILITSEQMGQPTSAIGMGNEKLAIGASNGLFMATNSEEKKWILGEQILTAHVNQALKIENRTFFATADGLVELNKKCEIVNRFLDEANVVALTADSTGHLWVATERALFRMNLKSNGFEELKPNTNNAKGLPSNIVYSLATDVMGNVWMVNKHCISMCNTANMEFTNHVEPSERGTFNHLVTDMFEDSRGYLWVGYSMAGGVSQIDPKTEKVRSFVHLEWDSLSFPNAATWSIAETSNGQMLFGTDAGLAIMHGDENRFQIIDDSNGLPAKMVTAVAQDANGLIWVGTSNGLAKYNMATGNVETFGTIQGALGGEISTICKFGPNQMVVAGEWGLNIFNPSHVFKDTVAAPIYITSISISGNVTHYFPDSRQRIVLGSNHKTLDIAFVALDFSAAENIKYRYQLEGFEDSLTTVNGGNLSVKYSNLPWGKYTFKVFCTNADGVWGTTPAQLFFKVRLPFYLRWWFIIFCLSVFGALFYFIVKTREAYLKAENLRLDSIIQERTEEVLTQNEELRVQRDIIGQQSDEIKQVNIHLTDSIEYALTLQNALMPSKIEFEAVLGASMLIFKPKDIVSGDLYWLKGSYEKFTLVVGDCTGHGVHGGFMSMMGLTFISESYAANPNANPLELLITVHQHFAETLKLATNNPTLTSGMDIAICEVDRKLGVMSYSGARLPLYLLKQNGNNCTLDKYKSGKKPVGSPWFTPDVPLIEIPINPGDTLVLATDGAFDQLSLVERKRFNRVQFEEVLLRNQPQPIDKLSTAIERELSAWQDKGIQTDDITVLGFVV